MSIRQNPRPTRLPDFANLGVMLRSLLAVNLLGDGLRDALDPRMAKRL